MKLWIILFKDNCIVPTRIKPDKKDYQSGTRFFEVKDSVDLCMLSHWFASGFDLEHFKEVK